MTETRDREPTISDDLRTAAAVVRAGNVAGYNPEWLADRLDEAASALASDQPTPEQAGKSEEEWTPGEVVGFCPEHRGEFYVPHGGKCPGEHFNDDDNRAPDLIEYVPRSALQAAEAEVGTLAKTATWLLGDDTGLSSETICAYMLGIERVNWRHGHAPHDEADRGRCARLLSQFPEWEPRLEELVALNDEWAEQIPLIRAALSNPPSEVSAIGEGE